MSLKQTILIKAAIVIVHLLFCHLLFAQTEAQNITIDKEQYQLKKYNLFDNSLNYQPGFFIEPTFFNSPFPAIENYNPASFFQNNATTTKFSFSQNKIESIMPGLGLYSHYTNQFRWNVGKKTTLDFGAGLVMQNTIIDPFIPNYQISFRAVFEYTLNDWLSAYFFGQYITKPFNKPGDYFDPFMHNNPLFIQSEIGAGMKTGFKKTNIDFQINSIYDTKFGGMTPVNSKIRIEF
ncbi:MAG: hypothetical protein LC658_11175 [Bacteroidales bacterium]|nr:hypothetical protein [Bacteroidales bacterium]